MAKIYKGKIEGDLVLTNGDDISALTSVGGSVYVRPGATFEAAALTSVGGYDLPDPETAKARLIEVAKHALAEAGEEPLPLGRGASE